MVKTYEILSAADLFQLTTMVQTVAEDGWQPLGGVAYDGSFYLQAIGHPSPIHRASEAR